jgi:hypothetical protein
MNEKLPSTDVIEPGALTPVSIDEVKRQILLIQDLMHSVMQDGEHYGTIPGTKKKSLLKAGAEKLGFTFRLTPDFEIQQTSLDARHREFSVKCTLTSIVTGRVWGQGVGSCSTMESKYAFREGKRVCPECHTEALRKAKAERGGGYYCWAKIGGCGAQFKAGDKRIEDQPIGRVPNEDLPDCYNTVLKMAKKRAHVDAILTATAASDIFTQDLEELTDEYPTTSAKQLPPQTPETSLQEQTAEEETPRLAQVPAAKKAPAPDVPPDSAGAGDRLLTMAKEAVMQGGIEAVIEFAKARSPTEREYLRSHWDELKDLARELQ